MPSVSAKQHRAMEAAAHGKGKLGIPPSVAREFVKHDAARKARKTKTKSGGYR